jgi:(2Fe-2S) ferredoxin
MNCRKKLYICTKGKSCLSADSKGLFKVFKKAVQDHSLKSYYKVKRAKCLSVCGLGPAMKIEPDGIIYGGLSSSNCLPILNQHLSSYVPIDELVVKRQKKRKQKREAKRK